MINILKEIKIDEDYSAVLYDFPASKMYTIYEGNTSLFNMKDRDFDKKDFISIAKEFIETYKEGVKIGIRDGYISAKKV